MAVFFRAFPVFKKQCRTFITSFSKLTISNRFFYLIGSLFIVVILSITFWASLLPPHLNQEFDVLGYHYAIPRQHLIINSFKHITWSVADLYFLPLDFSLAPFWFATELPNKLPQFLFVLGLFLVSLNLLNQLGQNKLFNFFVLTFAIFGLHGLGIQMGTAMLDIIIAYLFLSALDSFISGFIYLGIVEFTFFFWAKSFMPFQITAILILMFLLVWLLKKIGLKKINEGFGELDLNIKTRLRHLSWKKPLIVFCLLSFIIGGPFIGKSLYYTGTPSFPFVPGALIINKNINLQSKEWSSILVASKRCLQIKDNYGHGRSFISFLSHFWLVAVPEEGVNNKYDYPMGLSYLIFLGLFIYFFCRTLLQRQIPLLPLFVVIYWGVWWLGSQQARFLYIPVILMMILAITRLNFNSKVLIGVLLFGLLLNTLSIFRAHKNDFVLPREKVLRDKDKTLLEFSRKYIQEKRKDKISLDYHDVAFAQFPVVVTKGGSPHPLVFEE